MKVFKKFLCFSFLCLSAFLCAQEIDFTSLDLYLDDLEASGKFMGSVAISKEGQQVYQKTVGYADVENNVRATDESRYRIGSISKMFTAVLVFKAIEQKRIGLHQTVDHFFPAVPKSKRLTIFHLLAHRSGLYNFKEEDIAGWYTKPKTEKELMDMMIRAGSSFEPGEKMEYNNSNYVLLTFILEKVFGDSYSDLLEKYVTAPLGMKNTYFELHSIPNIKEVKSYKMTNQMKALPSTHASILLGTGGVVSTSGDLLVFINSLFEGKLLSGKSMEDMKTFMGSRGLGLVKRVVNSRVGFGHEGRVDGFNSYLFYFPENRMAVAVNSNGIRGKISDVFNDIVSIADGEEFLLTENKEKKEVDLNLSPYVGSYFSRDLKLRIEIVIRNNRLQALVPGSRPYILDGAGEGKFTVRGEKAFVMFDLERGTAVLSMIGETNVFIREK